MPYVLGGPQADGRRYGVFTYAVNGDTETAVCLLDEGADPEAHLAALEAGVPVRLAGLKAAEIAGNMAAIVSLGSEAELTFHRSTAAENRAAGRAVYAAATRLEAVMIGDFLAGLTNNQLGNIFGLTNGQITTLRAEKLTPARNAADAIRAAAGA